ncbi:protein mono-ADP-ribosyltransferase PARP12-like [Cylas formicarius]|uniref:protein mono-ADP-ribosyltransferase PARP12-like n=1 Tax=Cylas formicarius TaxID=197179 RepID=UPI0029585DC7|nr:protein mono-ADP-ribosyltransferase PARP12-like [Cylas formicarius]XP_060519075.1 protein mono-ADP-ribosyltransferase PARP12-like [Cylas formicarius]
MYYPADPVDGLIREFSRLKVAKPQANKLVKRKTNYHKKRELPRPLSIRFNPSVLNIELWSVMQDCTKAMEFVAVEVGTIEFNKILNKLPPSLYVSEIKKVCNPFLKLSFDLKRSFWCNNVTPLQLFHGTKQKYVDNICLHNFNWRYSGKDTGHRYGKGVNFTSKPKFALNFCDKNSADKVLILAEVLCKAFGEGKENLLVPPYGCDTVTACNGIYVKFCDGEFYPKYVLHVRKYNRKR